MTLLTPADDPNTFELVARNLKMKARGNQKSNEANQIKSSPSDTENYEKIAKINRNRWKSRLGLALGALGGGLGAIWAPKAVWHGKKEPDDQKMTAAGLPVLGPF